MTGMRRSMLAKKVRPGIPFDCEFRGMSVMLSDFVYWTHTLPPCLLHPGSVVLGQLFTMCAKTIIGKVVPKHLCKLSG